MTDSYPVQILLTDLTTSLTVECDAKRPLVSLQAAIPKLITEDINAPLKSFFTEHKIVSPVRSIATQIFNSRFSGD